MHFAVKNGHKESVELLLDKGSKVDAMSIDMRTPLHMSLRSEQYEISRLLIEKGGASVRARSKDGLLPMHLAILGKSHDSSADLDIISLLIDKGANINEPDFNLHTSLHVACITSNSLFIILN